MGWASRIALIPILLAIGGTALAQGEGGRGPADSGSPNASNSPSGGRPDPDSASLSPLERLWKRLLVPLSHEDDPDGPINTDRPTFTPANTVVPNGRFQVESGYTYTHDLTRSSRTDIHDFPELAVRVGIADRVEFRTFWLGQNYQRVVSRTGGPTQAINGPSDMEIGFKTQLIPADKDRTWLPTTALITSIMAPTGGASPYSSQTVNPYINLMYGWSLTDKLTLAGSTGYLASRTRGSGGPADSFERYNQSLVAFLSATEKTTFFYEWYAFFYTNAADNRPNHFMDGGLLYHPTPNTQIDVRAGFGLGDRPSDLFTGAGFSVRF